MSDELTIKAERVHKFDGDGALKAYVDLNVSDVFVIKGLRVVNGPKGLFVSMPQEQGKDKKWYEVVRCLSKKVRSQITDEVMAAYEGCK